MMAHSETNTSLKTICQHKSRNWNT